MNLFKCFCTKEGNWKRCDYELKISNLSRKERLPSVKRSYQYENYDINVGGLMYHESRPENSFYQ